MKMFGFKVEGLGFGFKGLRSRSNLFRVHGLGFGCWCLKWSWGSKCRD